MYQESPPLVRIPIFFLIEAVGSGDFMEDATNSVSGGSFSIFAWNRLRSLRYILFPSGSSSDSPGLSFS